MASTGGGNFTGDDSAIGSFLENESVDSMLTGSPAAHQLIGSDSSDLLEPDNLTPQSQSDSVLSSSGGGGGPEKPPNRRQLPNIPSDQSQTSETLLERFLDSTPETDHHPPAQKTPPAVPVRSSSSLQKRSTDSSSKPVHLPVKVLIPSRITPPPPHTRNDWTSGMFSGPILLPPPMQKISRSQFRPQLPTVVDESPSRATNQVSLSAHSSDDEDDAIPEEDDEEEEEEDEVSSVEDKEQEIRALKTDIKKLHEKFEKLSTERVQRMERMRNGVSDLDFDPVTSRPATQTKHPDESSPERCTSASLKLESLRTQLMEETSSLRQIAARLLREKFQIEDQMISCGSSESLEQLEQDMEDIEISQKRVNKLTDKLSSVQHRLAQYVRGRAERPSQSRDVLQLEQDALLLLVEAEHERQIAIMSEIRRSKAAAISHQKLRRSASYGSAGELAKEVESKCTSSIGGAGERESSEEQVFPASTRREPTREKDRPRGRPRSVGSPLKEITSSPQEKRCSKEAPGAESSRGGTNPLGEWGNLRDPKLHRTRPQQRPPDEHDHDRHDPFLTPQNSAAHRRHPPLLTVLDDLSIDSAAAGGLRRNTPPKFSPSRSATSSLTRDGTLDLEERVWQHETGGTYRLLSPRNDLLANELRSSMREREPTPAQRGRLRRTTSCCSDDDGLGDSGWKSDSELLVTANRERRRVKFSENPPEVSQIPKKRTKSFRDKIQKFTKELESTLKSSLEAGPQATASARQYYHDPNYTSYTSGSRFVLSPMASSPVKHKPGGGGGGSPKRVPGERVVYETSFIGPAKRTSTVVENQAATRINSTMSLNAQPSHLASTSSAQCFYRVLPNHNIEVLYPETNKVYTYKYENPQGSSTLPPSLINDGDLQTWRPFGVPSMPPRAPSLYPGTSRGSVNYGSPQWMDKLVGDRRCVDAEFHNRGFPPKSPRRGKKWIHQTTSTIVDFVKQIKK